MCDEGEVGLRGSLILASGVRVIPHSYFLHPYFVVKRDERNIFKNIKYNTDNVCICRWYFKEIFKGDIHGL